MNEVIKMKVDEIVIVSSDKVEPTTPKLQNKTVNINANGTTEITADAGHDGLGKVEVIVNVDNSDSEGDNPGNEDMIAKLLNLEIGGNYSNSNIKRIGNYAFAQQKNLTMISLPNATNIFERAFYQCENLEQANLPQISTLPDYCFNGCKSLTSLRTADITSIGEYAMTNTTEFKIDFIANNMTTAMGTNAFGGSGIKSFTAAKLNTITAAFKNCPNLEKVDLGGNTLTTATHTIAASAFSGSAKLATLILRNESKIYDLKNVSALTGTAIAEGTGYIYVPDALVDTYKAATNWTTYAAQIKPLSELPM